MAGPITKADLVAFRNAVLAINQAEVSPTLTELRAYWVQSIKETVIASAQQGKSSYTTEIIQNISSRSDLGRDIVAGVVTDLGTAFVTTGMDSLNITYISEQLTVDWS